MSPQALELFDAFQIDTTPTIEVARQEIPYVLVDYPAGLVDLSNTTGYTRSSMGILFQLSTSDQGLLHYLGAYNLISFSNQRLLVRVGEDGLVKDGSFNKSGFSYTDPRSAVDFAEMTEEVIKSGHKGKLYEQIGDFEYPRRLD